MEVRGSESGISLPPGDSSATSPRNMGRLEIGLALASVGVVLAAAGLAMAESDAERTIREANEARDAALKKQLADEAAIAENARRDAEASKRFMPKVNRKGS